MLEITLWIADVLLLSYFLTSCYSFIISRKGIKLKSRINYLEKMLSKSEEERHKLETERERLEEENQRLRDINNTLRQGRLIFTPSENCDCET